VATLVVVFRWGAHGVLWGGLISTAVLTAGVLAATITTNLTAPALHMFRGMFQFATSLGVGGIAMFIIHSGDRLFLQRYTSLADIGVYGLAYKIGMLVSYAQSCFGAFWSANAYTILQSEDGRRVFARMNTYQMLAVTYIAVLVVAFSSPLLRIVTPPQFWGAIALVPGITVAYLVRTEGDFFRQTLLVSGRPGLAAKINWAGAIVCLAAYWILIQRWTLWGAIVATILTFSVILLISYFIARKHPSFALEGGRLAKIIAVGIGAGLTAVAVQGSSMPVTIGVALLIAVAFPAALWLIGFPLPAERAAVGALRTKATNTILRRNRLAATTR
jgi:O-antigen/teichoic acid export membrane protein